MEAEAKAVGHKAANSRVLKNKAANLFIVLALVAIAATAVKFLAIVFRR